jgi:hypothetical protein
VKSYLQYLNKLSENEIINITELNYLNNRCGIVSDRLSMRDLIYFVEKIDWIEELINYT